MRSPWEPVPQPGEATRPPETPVLGIVALGLGLAGLTLPYFEAMVVVPGAFLCGLIALRKGESLLEKGLGGVGLALGLLGVLYIAF